MKHVIIFEDYNNTNVVLYRGGNDTNKSRLLYFTPNIKYAKWFSKNNSNGEGKIFKIEINPDSFLDLRSYGYKGITQLKFKDILNDNGITSPKWLDDNIKMGMGKIKSPMWAYFIEPKDVDEDFNMFWNNISSKYKGIIISEKNPEASYLGVNDAYIIDIIFFYK